MEWGVQLSDSYFQLSRAVGQSLIMLMSIPETGHDFDVFKSKSVQKIYLSEIISPHVLGKHVLSAVVHMQE